MTLRERQKRIQEPLLRFLGSPQALVMLPGDARGALGELSTFLGELVNEVEQLKGANGEAENRNV